ncbi:MAG: carbohydrate kinase family protein [Patescibacteria group bacterium]
MKFPNLNKIVVYGSLAYDRVMDFPGRFKDNFIANKLHNINVSFAVPTLKESFGGTAGNISYNLCLLKYKPIILSSVGNDFSKYKKWLQSRGVNTLYLNLVRNTTTASAYIITDKDDNQITGFYFGAMQIPYRTFPVKVFNKSMMIIAPGNVSDMKRLVKLCKRTRTPYIYDPAQQIPILSSTDLALGVTGSHVFIGNDYEISLTAKKLGLSEKSLINKCKILIRTLGSKGSEIWYQGKRIRIPAVKAKKVVDPTGAGDAYRAGLVDGLLRGWPLTRSSRQAAAIASRAVEKYGTQNHKFNSRVYI